jgi:hypothetical protein
MAGKPIARARRKVLDELGEDKIFAMYIEYGSVSRLMDKVIGRPDGVSEMSWGRADFYKWLRASPERWERWQQAKLDRGHVEADMIADVADNVTPETAGMARVKISAHQWRAERLNRQEYGPPQAQVNVGVAVQVGQSWLEALKAMQSE